MILRPFIIGLDRFADVAYFFSLRMGLSVVMPAPVVDVSDLILVGDGTPESYVLVILAHHLNGRKTVGLAKHEQLRGLTVLRDVATYITAAARLRTLVLIVDRDDKRLDELTSEVEQRLNEAEVERGEVRDEGAIKEITLHHKGREICLIVLVNDCELVGARRYTIESHLLNVAERIFSHDAVSRLLREAGGDPKVAWAKLGKEGRRDVFEHMVKHPELVERVFPQHVRVLRRLDD